MSEKRFFTRGDGDVVSFAPGSRPTTVPSAMPSTRSARAGRVSVSPIRNCSTRRRACRHRGRDSAHRLRARIRASGIHLTRQPPISRSVEPCPSAASRRPGPSRRPTPASSSATEKPPRFGASNGRMEHVVCRNRLIERRLNAVRECSAPQSRHFPLRIADYCLAAMLVLGMLGAVLRRRIRSRALCRAKTMVSRSTSKR